MKKSGLVFNLLCLFIAGAFFWNWYQDTHQPLLPKGVKVDTLPQGEVGYLEPVAYDVPKLQPRWAGFEYKD